MADRDSAGAERDAEETDELFSTDLNDYSCASGRDSPPRKLDQCDLLLDALDAQLGQLQIQPTKHLAIPRERDCNDDADPLRWSHSLSKDTGLGSTTQTNDTPMSCLDLIQTPTKEPTSERGSGCRGRPTNQRVDRRTRDKEEMESQREQVLWRLERLLGDTCNEGRMEAGILPPSDSICTEDFVLRFRDEMVEWTFPESYMEKLDDGEEVTKRTEISDCQREHFILNVDRRALTGESSANTESAHDCRSEEKCVSNSHGVNASSGRKAGAGERCSSPRRLGDDGSHGFSPSPLPVSHRTEAYETTQLNNSCSPKARCLAGVPVWSFDTVSIDSDLDSVCTEQVRKHIHRRPGWRSLLQSVSGMEDHCTNHSDTHTQGASEPGSSSGRSFSYGKVHNRSPSVRKAPRNKRDSYRHVCSLDHNKKDTEEELTQRSGRCRPERTSQKMHSDWARMKGRLSTLQQKCEKEEQTLQRKKTQLKDVELSLSELQQRRRHALQELERLTVETAKMEEEKRTLGVALRDSRAGKDAISVQMHELQRQREVCVLEVRHLEEELTALSQRKQTLKEGRFTERQPSSVVFSLLEREEMERQLDSAKTELFTEQRRAREKLESTQEKLEETCEELQRVTEAESLLRTRCAYLEEKQRQTKDQIEAVEFKVSEMRGDLGECKVRVSTQEKMLAQKELQLLDVQEQRGALQAERDGLKGALKHLETQHCNASKEAHQQAQTMDAALKKEKKEMALAHEQQIQKLQEEEAKKLRDSLETQQQEATLREEQQHKEALEKAHKTIEEERRKWEAENEEDLQMHCGKLQEQNRKSLESMRSEVQRERSKALALQQEVVELKAEMESESCAQQREQESVTALMCHALKEKHRAELQRMQRQVAQERQRAEKESDGLRVMLGERESSHHQITAELQQRLRRWSQELGAETQHLQILLEQSAEGQSPVLLPHSPTAAEARVNLSTLREQLKHLISHLQQELHSQKQTTERLRKEKERELSVQRQQLRLDRDQALQSLKERLIQEHIEELSWPHMCDGGADGGGVAASLRKQLGAKDLELRQVQRSMAQWKEHTAARLACKFEEELTSELERKASKSREERPTEPGRPDGELALSAKEALTPACSPWRHVVHSAASHSPSDVASFKLLRFLQSRVKQLRVENQTSSWSPSPANTMPLD
ncbi:golgin subfamily A member 6-like protein 22 [Pseudochaenichthys georgianus]|uniref:golgin subfamily A member 6-like protein 22 n=1 Tax=Pseudochaenichthys georgianus TaxID=52239 RepID=UPI00146C3A95|nr:trichohyalin [Pseudochaenichthys georgianus]